jgi:hypothetical protein
MPRNRNFSFMTGSLPLVALNCPSFRRSQLNPRSRIGAGHSIVTIESAWCFSFLPGQSGHIPKGAKEVVTKLSS